MHILSRIVFALFGMGAAVFTVLTLVAPARLLPPAEAASAETVHVLREQGAAMAFVAAMALWCAARPAGRRPVHLGLVLFTAILAGIHWWDFAVGERPLASGLVNTVPFAVLVALLVADRP